MFEEGQMMRRLGVIAGTVMALSCAAAPSAAVSLPDGRAYELVSPPGKSGADVMPSTERTWAASDGDAVVFSSLAGFGDVRGTGIATDYLSQRETSSQPGNSGWTTHAITPPQSSLPVTLRNSGFDPMHVAFTSNLSTGVYQSWTSLTVDPYVDPGAKLYLQNGLRGNGPDTFSLVTTCPFCVATLTPLAPYAITPYNGLPKIVGMSADGSVVLFESVLKLTGDATEGLSSGTTNVYEWDHGTLSLASILPGEMPADDAVAGQGANTGDIPNYYTQHVLSSDGSRVIFTADPSLCTLAASSYTCGNLYLRDRGSGTPTTVQVNRTERSPDPGGHLPAIYWDASTDGARVFFTTDEQLTDDPGSGLYLYDASAPEGSRLTHIGDGADSVLGSSEDGHVVYFTSSTQLVSGAPAISGGASGIFEWTDAPGTPSGGELHYVGMLDFFLGNVVDNRIAGTTLTFSQRQSRVSPDGRFLLFSTTIGTGLLSVRGGTDYDQGSCSGSDNGTGFPGCRELYLYDAQQDTLRCVSCRPDGNTATANASVWTEQLIGASRTPVRLNHPLADDGGRVFFSTAEPLVPEDVNDRVDAYEWDAASGQPHLLSDGVDGHDSYFMDATPSGGDVVIDTRAQLVGWDTDGSYDLYDVRVGGGFPPPPPSPIPCDSVERCHGQVAPAPSVSTVGSDGYHGKGNVRARPPVKCGKGKVRRTVDGKVRCVRKHHRRVRCHQGKVRRRIHGHVRCVSRKHARRVHRKAK